VRIHVKERLQDFARFNAVWTPTLSFREADGTEWHRFVGFYPLDEFQAQLALGVAKTAFGRRNFQEALHSFEKLAAQFPNSDAAPEAVYWATASAFKVSGDAEFLEKGGLALREKYPRSIWAAKGSVWLHQ